ncbi:hypothetical protein ABW19_dt0200165 [Dactylella cylindrospora]|nr:hypothetical protein ABW19_dt0200165 [Dactylella cylindrospora]
MYFSKAIIALSSLAVLASAQSSTATAESPSGSVKVHVIQAMAVDGKPVFEPAEVQAAVGDLIQFQFHPMNHSVVRAAFADPCVPIEDSAAGNGTAGFYSGFMPVSADTTIMPTFTIPVENDRPIWFYCSQGRHCQSGMVGVINPTAERTLAMFMEAAAQAPANLSPGQEDAGSGAASTSVGSTPTPTTMQTSVSGGSATSSSTDVVATGAASKSGSSLSLVLAAVAASFFML